MKAISKIFKALALMIVIAVCGPGAKASGPWTVNPADFRYDMTVYAAVSFAGVPMDYSQYEVGVFAGDQCRGIGQAMNLPDGSKCLSLRVRSNVAQGETMTFRYRNLSTEEISVVDGVSFDFVADSRLGYPSEPYQVNIVRYFDVNITAATGGSVDFESKRLPEQTKLTVTATPNEGYHFTEWSDGVTENPREFTVDTDISAQALFEPNVYKLTYLVDDASYKEFDVTFGSSITPEANPSKVGHTFSGWSEIPATMPAHDVTVTGNFTINSYKATFRIGTAAAPEFEKVLTVVYGQPITAPEAPAKEGYSFDGWGEIPAAMPANDIVIEGSYTVNQYKLTYKVDDTLYKESMVDYGTALTAEAAPVKEGHSFSGWSEIPATMPAHDVTVTGTFSINSYEATFRIGTAADPEFEKVLTVVYGQPITAPEAPVKEGYTFAGWGEIPAAMPANDIVIEGSYTVNQYKLTYKVDDTLYKESMVDYGTALTAEAAPVKEGHTFSGWSEIPASMPAHDVTVTGTFSINSYKATFRIGTAAAPEFEKVLTVVYGQPITAPEAPVKEGYTFAGWGEIPAAMPARDIVIEGSYTVNQYKLTYKVDETLYKESMVDYGTALTAEAAPVKEGHTFSGWSEIPATMPAHDVTVTGNFTINSYKATFRIGTAAAPEFEKVLTVVYGQPITAPEAPAKEGYTFAGWGEIPAAMPARDIVIEGSYTVNQYKLTYKVDETLYKESMVDYGTALIAEAAPVKEGHTFSGWSEIPATMPAHDVTVTGTFSINSYTATFRIGSEDAPEFEKVLTVVYGQPIEAPEAPAKEGYTFSGWGEIPVSMPAQDLLFTGSYSVNTYKVIYKVDGEPYKEVGFAFGAEVTPEPDPVKEGHTFSGWSEIPATMPAHDVTVTGTFSINSYTATFRIGSEDAPEFEKVLTVVYGQPITAPEAPAKEGYTFAGWGEIPATMPAQDLLFTGSYTVNTYKVIYTVNGEPYKEVGFEFGAEVTPEPAPVKEGYTFSGWSEIPATMPAHDVTVTGTFSINSYTATFRIGSVDAPEFEKVLTVVYGQPIEAPEAPAKEGYTFAGWGDVPETMPAENLLFVGEYTVNIYKLIYVVDGETYKEVDMEYGAEITPEAEPVKEGHTFSGWSEIPATMPANDVTVTGSFIVNSYTIEWIIDDDLYKTETLEYGAEIVPPVVEDVPVGKKFAGWKDVPATMPAENIKIYGSYEPDVRVAGIMADDDDTVTIVTPSGILLYRNVLWKEVKERLTSGFYIVNGQKCFVKH